MATLTNAALKQFKKDELRRKWWEDIRAKELKKRQAAGVNEYDIENIKDSKNFIKFLNYHCVLINQHIYLEIKQVFEDYINLLFVKKGKKFLDEMFFHESPRDLGNLWLFAHQNSEGFVGYLRVHIYENILYIDDGMNWMSPCNWNFKLEKIEELLVI